MMDGLDLDGFSDPIPLSLLYSEGCGGLPCAHGVYVVVRDSADPPSFVDVSPAGRPKGLARLSWLCSLERPMPSSVGVRESAACIT